MAQKSARDMLRAIRGFAEGGAAGESLEEMQKRLEAQRSLLSNLEAQKSAYDQYQAAIEGDKIRQQNYANLLADIEENPWKDIDQSRYSVQRIIRAPTMVEFGGKSYVAEAPKTRAQWGMIYPGSMEILPEEYRLVGNTLQQRRVAGPAPTPTELQRPDFSLDAYQRAQADLEALQKAYAERLIAPTPEPAPPPPPPPPPAPAPAPAPVPAPPPQNLTPAPLPIEVTPPVYIEPELPPEVRAPEEPAARVSRTPITMRAAQAAANLTPGVGVDLGFGYFDRLGNYIPAAKIIPVEDEMVQEKTNIPVSDTVRPQEAILSNLGGTTVQSPIPIADIPSVYNLQPMNPMGDLSLPQNRNLMPQGVDLSQGYTDRLGNFIAAPNLQPVGIGTTPVFGYRDGGEVDAFIRRANGGSASSASSGVRRLKMSGYQEGGEVTDDMFTGTLPTDQGTSPGILPPEIRQAIDVPLDFANMALRGTAAAVAGPAYGLYKGLTSDQFGTKQGVTQARSEAERMMGQITGEPKTQQARDIMDFVGEKLEAAKVPPMPQFLTTPLPAPGSARAALRSYELAQEPPTGAITLDPLGMSSRLSEAVDRLQAKGTGEQLLAQLNKAQGVPQAEIKATGLDEFLRSAGKVTRDDIQSYLEKNRVNLIEDERSFAGAPIDELSKKTMGAEFPFLPKDFFNRRYANLDQVKEAGYNALKEQRDELQEAFTYGDMRSFNDRDGFEVLPDELDDWFRRENDYLDQYIDDIALEDSRVKHNQLTLPGGENYREVLFKLPTREGEPSFVPPASHYEDAANTFGSIRMTDRVVDGKPILFAEEVQSDWAIKGAKEGYDAPEKLASRKQQLSEAREALAKAEARAEAAKNAYQNRGPQDESLQLLGNMEFAKQNAEKIRRFINAIEVKTTPENPFKNNWYQPVMNRFLIKAAQEGKEGIGLTNGEVHIQRYNLRNYADKLKYNPDLKLLEVYRNAEDENPMRIFQNVDRDRLGKQIGQDMADKLLSAKADGNEYVLQGDQLEVGGSGKNTFYDKILPDYLNKIGKKYGVKVETRTLPAFDQQQKSAVNPLGNISDEKAREIYYLPITEEMRNDLLGKGLPTFAEGGEVTNEQFIQEMLTGTAPSDTTTQPGILPPEIRQAIDVPLDLANLAIRGTAGAIAGPAYGLYKGLTGGKYGTREGVTEARSEAERMMSEITGEPKTQTAKDIMQFVGEKMEEAKIPPMPQYLTTPVPGAGTTEFIKQAARREFEAPPVGAVTLKPTAATDLGIKKLEGGLIFPEDETAERLRLKMQRQQAFEEKGKAMPGAPKNARTVIKAPKGSDLPDFVVGDIKPQDWIARTEKMLSPDEIQQYGRWYDDVRGTFLKYTGGDENLTDKYMRAWLVANQNIGVEGAFNNVLLQAEQFARNVPADQMRAGGLPFATQAARNALQDEPITEGVGLKIADFVDSAEGKGTRSIYGNAREAGAPFVVDIHTARDTGLVDDILLNHLERNGYKVDRNQIKTDLATGPTDTQYENRADFGRNLTQYLNDNNWQGRNDWTPKEIQAIGWMAMTKLTRDAADDTVTALERSLRRLSMEFSPGEGSPWAVKFGDRFNALEPEGQRELTQVATSRAVDMAKQVAGIDLRSVVHGSGGWQKFQNPATVAQTLATKEGSEIAANALGYLLNQTEVWSNAVKGMTKNPKAFAVDFVQKKGDDLSTDQGIMSFWEKVMEADPTGLFVGYQPIRTANNEPGIRVIVDKGGAKRMQDIQAALEGPIAKMIKDSPLDIAARGYENELVKAVNNWKENPDGQLYLARLADLGIGDPAARLNPLRSELETAIESWFSNRAGAAKAGSKTATPEAAPAAAGARRRGKGTTSAAEDLAAVSPTAPAVSRIEMGYKDVTKRVPELTKGARDLLDGKITWQDYNALVDQYKPVTPYSFVPEPATAADALRALDSRKQKSFSVIQTGIQAGEPTELRLDIPAYKDHGVWVNSIHRPGQPTSYASISSIKNARMIGPDDVRLQEKALEVASGEKAKGPFAVIKGEWEPVSEKEAVARAQQYLNDPEWTQVGYDPERHSYFYDRTTTEPVVAADEVLQIGPLVLAKNAKFAKKEQFKFKDGGEVNAFIKAKAR